MPAKTRAISSLALLIVATFLGVYQLLPPAPLPATAPADVFSAARAMEHVTTIAREPHPTGTSANADVRTYIKQQLLALGLEPQTQSGTAVFDKFGPPYLAGSVVNVVARIPGEDPSRAILLVGHYDSVAMGNGAADDGHAVALLLETARALKIGPSLKNDVILLFTDGEELGMLGAQAFVRDNALAKEVGLVLNFEGRGTGGPEIMYETSPDSGALLRAYGQAAPYPMASSLATAIYRMMPNGSDFSEFLAGGLPGLNFSFINGGARYHTARDDVAHLDRGTVQMAGANTLAIIRHFGNRDLTQLTAPDSVYFNPVRFLLIRYPIGLAMPLAVVIGLMLAGLIVWSARRGRVSLRGLGAGFLAALSALILTALAVLVLGTRIQAPYHTGFANLGYAGIGIFLAMAAIVVLRRWARLTELVAGGLVAGLIALVMATRSLPEGSYLIAWPMLFGLAAFVWLLRVPDPERPAPRDWAVMALLAVPPILGVVPLLYLAFVALPLMFGAWIAVAVTLLALLVAPHIFWIVGGSQKSDDPWATAATSRFVLPAVALLTVVAFVIGAVAGPSYMYPRRDSIYYGLNTSTGRAVFGSPDPDADAYTAQFLGKSPIAGSALKDAFRPEEQLQADAPVMSLAAPTATLLSDRTDGSVRTVRLQVRSRRQAPAIELVIGDQSAVTAVSVNGRFIGSDRPRGWPWQAIYFGAPADGVTFEVQLPAGTELVMRVTDISQGLPSLPGMTVSPRTGELVPGWMDGTTQVAAIFRF